MTFAPSPISAPAPTPAAGMRSSASRLATPREAYQLLLDRLAEFRQQVRERLLLEGLARVLAAAVGLCLLMFVLDRLFRLSLPARMIMLALAGAGVLVVVWRDLISVLRLKLDSLTLVAAVDARSGRHGDLLSLVGTVLELPAAIDRPGGTSMPMLQDAVERAHEELTASPFDSGLNNARRNLAIIAIITAVLVPTLLASASPQSAALWARRVFTGSNEPWPQKTYLQVDGVIDNAVIVARGEPFVLRVHARQGSVVPEVATIRFREEGASKVDANLTAFGPNDFRYDFSAINSPTTVEISGGDDTLGPILLKPADRPKLAEIELTTQHPTESKPTMHRFDGGDSDLSFLPLTRMHLQFTANTPLAAATIKCATTQPAEADLHRVDDRHYSLDWIQSTAVSMQIDLLSRDAQLAAIPTTLAIGLKTDQPPRVTLAYTGVKTRVTAQATIPMTIDARDDYGLADVALVIKTEIPDTANPGQLKAAVKTLPLYGHVTPTVINESQPAYRLSLNDLNLPQGSLVTVSASATDACYTGAQTTASRQVVFRVVPGPELFREILLRQQSERAKFRKQTDEAADLQHAISLAATPADIFAISHRQRALQREVVRITTSLTDSLTELRLNALGTDEAYGLMQRNVLSPLKDLNDQLLNPQKDAIDALKAGDTPALAAARDRQDQTVAQMNTILKQMSQWDSFVDVLNQLNEVIKLQTQAQQNTTEMRKKQTDSIFDK